MKIKEKRKKEKKRQKKEKNQNNLDRIHIKYFFIFNLDTQS